jgi:hypothetical protein
MLVVFAVVKRVAVSNEPFYDEDNALNRFGGCNLPQHLEGAEGVSAIHKVAQE